MRTHVGAWSGKWSSVSILFKAFVASAAEGVAGNLCALGVAHDGHGGFGAAFVEGLMIVRGFGYTYESQWNCAYYNSIMHSNDARGLGFGIVVEGTDGGGILDPVVCAVWNLLVLFVR